MKWTFLIIGMAGVIPLARWLRCHPREITKIWILIGFLVLQHGPLHLYMAVISWATWPGYTPGAEISLLDVIGLAVYLSLPRAQHSLPFKYPIAFYFVTVLLSALQASAPEAALFYAWQLARVFFFYAIVAKASADPRVAPALLKGLALGLLLAACEAIWERFALGILRTHGGYAQENFFGVVSQFIIFPFFALLLAGERGWLAPIISLAGILISVLTVSRATLAFSGFGYTAMFVISAIRRWTSRKALIAAVGLIAMLPIVPLFVSSYADRFSGDIASSFLEADSERIALASSASMMLTDHPMGVGANQFVISANTKGYYSRAGVSWTSFSATVHNVYWLVAAETGYLGLIAFVILLIRPIVTAFLCGWRNRGDQRGDLLLGLGIALVTVYFHSFYEWIFITFQVQYIFAATIGLVAGIAQQLGYWSYNQVVETNGATYFAPRR